ncbi:MAG TPA: ATP-binding cassette domain-containing protein [Firmicutes bacterium]|nr:ATP-binding cassette domain-containing protein [Bacillota bacterium]HHT41843.1 ATP-binding cassette domain-containing protein [Bacillota bacterium]
MEKIIEVRGLVKSYGEIEAVRGIDFYVERGRLFAFLGPNGAGKSTTVEILSTALKKDAGEVVINGFTLGREDDEIRSSMGVVFQGNFLDDRLTVRGNLLTRGSFYGLKGKELEEAVEQAAYEAAALDFMEQRYGSLSGGQRRRADLARALVNRPKILFLDEPTTGLDAQTRRSVWEYIRRMQEQRDMTVFLTTHYMEEAAQADYVLVIDHGLIAAKGTPAQLKEAYASDQLRLYSSRVEEITAILREMGLNFEQRAGFVTASIPTTLQALPIVERCRDYLSGFEVLQGTMDDAFLAITGKEIRS